jgi:hypothetical protein
MSVGVCVWEVVFFLSYRILNKEVVILFNYLFFGQVILFNFILDNIDYCFVSKEIILLFNSNYSFTKRRLYLVWILHFCS